MRGSENERRKLIHIQTRARILESLINDNDIFEQAVDLITSIKDQVEAESPEIELSEKLLIIRAYLDDVLGGWHESQLMQNQ
jgi:hypothetical protein